jgi:hypothetical protein
MNEQKLSAAEVRINNKRNFMEKFINDPILSETIPNVAIELMKEQFDINTYDKATVPIIFTTTWKEILAFVYAQKLPEFSMDVGGVTIEYVTVYSESDKPKNIEPRMYHTRTPIFKKEDHQRAPGVRFTDELLNKYSAWRTVNLTETLTSIENKVYKEILETYGIQTYVPAAIFPYLSAIYVAGLQVARETQEEVNMYNVFKIKVVNDEVFISPFPWVKTEIKYDEEK